MCSRALDVCGRRSCLSDYVSSGARLTSHSRGIGENGHLAFNEPPADFEREEPFLVVNLAEQTRLRLRSHGDFDSLQDVPEKAVTMAIRQIVKSRAIICIATGKRKARAVEQCFAGGVSPLAPASALQLHPHATIYVDSTQLNQLRLEDHLDTLVGLVSKRFVEFGRVVQGHSMGDDKTRIDLAGDDEFQQSGQVAMNVRLAHFKRQAFGKRAAQWKLVKETAVDSRDRNGAALGTCENRRTKSV
jgi:hypothetical protein